MTFALRSGVQVTNAMGFADLVGSEYQVASLPNLDLWVSGREPALGARDVRFIDRERSVEFISQGSAGYGAVGDLPAILLSGSTDTRLDGSYIIPSSYAVLVLLRVSSFATENLVFGSQEQSGNRMFLAFNSGGAAGLAHAANQIELTLDPLSTGVNAIVWGSFDSSDKSAALALNTLTPQATGDLVVDQKAYPFSSIGGTLAAGGGSSIWPLDGYVMELLIFNKPLHKAAFNNQLVTAVNWLATYGGVTLT